MTQEINEVTADIPEVVEAEELAEAVERIESEAEPVTDESESEPEPDKKPRKDAQSRINQLTKQKNDAIAEAEYWKSKANESEGSRQDLAMHEANKAEAKANAISNNVWDEQKSEIADFDEVVGKSKAQVLDHVLAALNDSDVKAKLIYHLAKNPSELEQLNDMSERGALKHIAKLESILEQKKAPHVRTSNAPEPIKPVTSVRGVVAKNPADMNIDEYTAWRRANGAKW